jgi:O-acetyl-ADP-ribose deacetylase (regulator of RNase III)
MQSPVVTQVSGDLFDAPADAALAHCVSQCLTMGKGIAVRFKQRYGRVFNHQATVLRQANARNAGKFIGGHA